MNEQVGTIDASMKQPIRANDERAAVPSLTSTTISPQGGCSTCGGAGGGAASGSNGDNKPAYVYAIGRIEARFPNLAAEKEFAQAAARTDTIGKTDQQTLHAVVSKRENRYLARQLCWVVSIQGLDTYLLVPRDRERSICW